MSQYLVSEDQVKKALQIDSFRNLSKDKIMEFASLIPHMDKDVALAIINQFPAYVESSRNMIEQYKNIPHDQLDVFQHHSLQNRLTDKVRSALVLMLPMKRTIEKRSLSLAIVGGSINHVPSSCG